MAASAPPKMFGATIDKLTSRTVFRWTRQQTAVFIDFGQLYGFEKKAEIAAADLQPLLAALGLACLDGERNHLNQDVGRDVVRPKVVEKMARLMKEGRWKAKHTQITAVQVKEEEDIAAEDSRASTFYRPALSCIVSDGSETEPDVVAKTKKVTNEPLDGLFSARDAIRRRRKGVRPLASRKVFVSSSDSEDIDHEGTEFTALTKAFSASNVSEVSRSRSEDIDCLPQSSHYQLGPYQRLATTVKPTNGLLVASDCAPITPESQVPSSQTLPSILSNSTYHQFRPSNSATLGQIADLKDMILELWHRLIEARGNCARNRV